MLNRHIYSQYFLRIVNTFIVFCCQTVTTFDQSCRQCSWLSSIFNVLIRTNCSNKARGLFTRIFNGRLKSDSWFRLARGCQELIGPRTALYTLLLGDHRHWRECYTHEGSGRAAPAAGAVQAGPGCGRGQGRRRLSALAGQHHAGQRELLPSLGAGTRAGSWCVPAPGTGASTCPVCRRRASLLYKWTFCSSTHCTYRLHNYYNAARISLPREITYHGISYIPTKPWISQFW